MLHVHVARAHQRDVNTVANDVVEPDVTRAAQRDIEVVGIHESVSLEVARALQFNTEEEDDDEDEEGFKAPGNGPIILDLDDEDDDEDL
jgi:hypothetical protein